MRGREPVAAATHDDYIVLALGRCITPRRFPAAVAAQRLP